MFVFFSWETQMSMFKSFSEGKGDARPWNGSLLYFLPIWDPKEENGSSEEEELTVLFCLMKSWRGKQIILMKTPSPRKRIPRHVWRPAPKKCFWILFLSAVQGVLTYSLFRYLQKKTKKLINKTVGPQYSLTGLPPGISMSQLSALMVYRYLDFDGCIS